MLFERWFPRSYCFASFRIASALREAPGHPWATPGYLPATPGKHQNQLYAVSATPEQYKNRLYALPALPGPTKSAPESAGKACGNSVIAVTAVSHVIEMGT